MDHRNPGRHLAERERPVDGRIAAARDHHALAAEGFALRDVVENALALVGFYAWQRRSVWTEGTDAGRHDHGPRLQDRALGSRHLPEAAAQRLQRLDLLAEVIDRPKRRRLGLQPDHQFGRLDAGKTGNVVDRLFGIERRALPPGIVKHVDNVAIEPDHAALEDGKQSRGPRAYNDDVGLMRMSGVHIPTVAKMMPKIKAPGDWIVRGPEFGSWGRT